MKRTNAIGVTSIVLTLFATASFASQHVTTNGSMEVGGGPNATNPLIPDGWTLFGAVSERSTQVNLTPSGVAALKAFGAEAAIGAFQDVPANPGDAVTISASMLTLGTDKIDGDAQAGLTLEFLDVTSNTISATENFIFDSTSTPDVWTPVSITTNAPAGTVTARFVCTWTSGGAPMGSAFWDECSMDVNGGTNGFVNGGFEAEATSGMSPTGITDWTGFGTQEKSEDFAFVGTSSVKVTAISSGGGSFNGLFHDMGLVEAGDRIVMKVRALHRSDDPLTVNARGGLKMEFQAAGAPPSLPAPTENLVINSNSTTNAWIDIDLGTTGLIVPAEANFARITVILSIPSSNLATNGEVWFDSAFADLNNSGFNELLNSSFESGTGGANGINFWTEFGFPPFGTTRKNIPVDDVGTFLADDGISVAQSTGSFTTGIFQEVAVDPGDFLRVMAKARVPQGGTFSDGAGMSAGLKVEWRGGAAPPPIDFGLPSNTLFPGDATDTWKELTLDFTMPLGSRAILRTTGIVGGFGNGTVYFDGFESVITNRFAGADVDGNNTMDLLDMSEFSKCFTGPGAGSIGWPCRVFDFDEDVDVDNADWSAIDPVNNATGP